MKLASDTHQDIRAAEAEAAPNRYTARALIFIFLALLVAAVFDAVGIFDVNPIEIWGCAISAAIFCVIANVLAWRTPSAEHPLTKYAMLLMSVILTLEVLVLFNISAFLLIFFPMLISIMYRSVKLSIWAIALTCLCCIAYPIISWMLGTWSLNIMTGYFETVCHMQVVEMVPGESPLGYTLFCLIVYLSLPQLLVILVFGLVFLGIAHRNMQALEDQIGVIQLTADLQAKLDHIASMQDDVIYAVADMVESRDGDTGGHIRRTSRIVELLAQEVQKEESTPQDPYYYRVIYKAASLHDLGKIAVDDAILRKPGKLTPEERVKIEEHSRKGAELIGSMLSGLEDEEFIRIAENIALYHHEWYDGTGYPEHLSGKAIPLEARVMAIADVYDALVSKRSYKMPFSHDEARAIIIESMGSQFDPDLRNCFESVAGRIQQMYTAEQTAAR